MGVTSEDVEIHQHAFYRHHVRAAERWREGRVFLLGDAGHLMPPWAGQGMQSGIRDAFNLSWKLHLVIAGLVTGTAAEALLDNYEAERAPNVAFMTAESERLCRIIKMQMTAGEKAQALLAAVLGKLGIKPPPLPIAMPPQLDAGWLSGAPAKGKALGKMPPQPVMGTAKGRYGKLDDLIGSGFVPLGDHCDPADLLSRDQRAEWDRLGASYRAVRSVDLASKADTDLIDRDGTLLAWMRAHGAKAIALRPDRFVVAEHVSSLQLPR